MAFPFTPAQLAAFRSALANLAEAIAQGDKALGDADYIRLNQAAMPKPELEPVKPAPVAEAPNIQVQPAAPLTQASTPVVEVKSPVVKPPVAPKPASVPAPAPDVSKPKSKGLFGLNWFGKKSTEEDKEEKPVAAKTVTVKVSDKQEQQQAKPPTEVEKAARVRIADGWVANSFFAELPWSRPNDKSITTTGQLVGQQAELARYYPKDASSVGDFFANVPWSVKPKVSLTPVASAALLHKAHLSQQRVNAYFTGLPWSEKKPGAVLSVAELAQARSASLSKQNVSAFFASAAWLVPPAQDKPAQPAVTGGLEKQPSAINIRNPAQVEANTMFAAATQSALVAAEKGRSNSPPELLRTDKYFNSLPWGSR